MAFKTQIIGFEDSSNSSTTPLGIGGVFTGVAVELLKYAAVAIIIKTDQDSATGGLSMEWSPDGTNWDHVQTSSIWANVTFTKQAMVEARYFRVVYTNGAIAQGAFRLQTLLLPTPSLGEVEQLGQELDDKADAQVVRAVIAGKNPGGAYVNFEATNGGNFKMSLEELENVISVNGNSQLKVTPFDSSGSEMRQPLTAFGDLRVAELTPLFQGSFEFTVDNTELNTNTEVGTGTVTQASGMGVVGTGTTAAGMAMLTSKHHAKYRPGLGGMLRFTALFTSPVAATEQYVGLSDVMGGSAAFANGYTIGYDGLTFGYHRFQNDVKFTTALADWDDPLDGTGASEETIDQTKLNVFFIQYQYLGAGAIKVFFEKQDGDVVLVHTDKYAGLNIEPSAHNPNFFFRMHVDNKATTSDLVMKSSSYAYFIEGKTDLQEIHRPQFASGLQSKGSVTTETALFTIRNKSTYASKVNFIDLLLERVSGSIEAGAANNLGEVRLVKNATLGGTPVWNDINTTDSIVEIDVAGTTVASGKELLSAPLAGKNDRFSENMMDFTIILSPGETLTVTGSSAASATIKGAGLWKELF